MTTHTHKVTVEGLGEFPIDMLRYDYCFPDTEADSALIMDRRVGTRRVRVVQLTANKFPRWTPGRWASFGWNLVPGSEGDL